MENTKELSSRERLLQAAREEFLEKGYEKASLRQIAKAAGMTTGAVYGYYSGKEDLFAALTDEQYRWFLDTYREGHQLFANLEKPKQKEVLEDFSLDYMERMLLYAYDHLDAFHLILECSAGTRYENLLDEMVEIELASTNAYRQVLSDLGTPAPPEDPYLDHLLVTGTLKSFLELILHDVERDKAVSCLRQMRMFFNAGWEKILGQ